MRLYSIAAFGKTIACRKGVTMGSISHTDIPFFRGKFDRYRQDTILLVGPHSELPASP